MASHLCLAHGGIATLQGKAHVEGVEGLHLFIEVEQVNEVAMC
jgi:hypothetical protein